MRGFQALLLGTALASLVLFGPAGCGSKTSDDTLPAVSTSPGEQVAVARTTDMEAADIMDPAGFGEPMVAATIQVPEGWQTHGGMTWDRSGECVSNYVRPKWLARSEDGSEFELMPGYSWQLQGTENMFYTCPTLPVRSPRELLEIVAQRYPSVRVLEYRDRPDMAAESPVAQRPGVQAHFEAGEMLIAYPRDGEEIREVLSATLSISQMQGHVAIAAPAVYAMRAPAGQLDLPLAEQIRKSLKVDQQWLARANQVGKEAADRIARAQRSRIDSWHAGEMAKINARGARERSMIAMQTSREVAQIYSEGWRNSQATDDRIQRRTLEAIGGYNTYADPSGGGTVRGSIEYDRVIRTDGGAYIGTNDPYYNPAGSEELERIP
ncbi:hypothetical protein [Steroidobacter sp.]|uniref:hypothetical protein n=1 Tax=Steroidobacter sp. TaxID=1978227 RepID=UPI001A452E5A|nr:hypothetical protein [Steroidobacter sp.]MBL8268182.1 hypothetical protein [Steroidobacter sp.]